MSDVRLDTGPVLQFEIPRLIEIGPPGCAGARSRLQPGDAVPEDLEFPEGQCGIQSRGYEPPPDHRSSTRETSGTPLSTIYRPLSFPQAPGALKQCYSCASQHSAFSTLFLPRSFLVQLPQQDTFLTMPKRRMSSATRSISVTRGHYHQGDPVTTQSPLQRVAWIQVHGKGYDSHLHLLNPVKRTTCQFQQPAAERIMKGVSAPSTNRKSCTIQSGMV